MGKLLTEILGILLDFYICLVSNSFLFGKKFEELRQKVLRDYNLKMIINFPSGILPYANIRSSLLYVEKSTPTKETLICDYKDNPDELISDFINKSGSVYVKPKQLTIRWTKESHDPIFVEIENTLKGEEIKRLDELAEVFQGYKENPSERLDSGEYLIIGGKNIGEDFIKYTKRDKYINGNNNANFQKSILQPGDIIISLLFEKRKIYLFKKTDPKLVLNSSCALIRSPENEYIRTYLNSDEGRKLFLKQASRVTSGAFIPRLSIKDLRSIRIPILPIDNLTKISDLHISRATVEELRALIDELNEGALSETQKNLKIQNYHNEMMSKIRKRIFDVDIEAKLEFGEGKKLEFKSTLRWNIKTKSIDRSIEMAALKTIAAFCNTEGGELLIGVADNSDIIGLSLDNFPNDDKYLLHLKNIIKERMKPFELVSSLIEAKIIEHRNKKICYICCEKSDVPIYIHYKKDGVLVDDFYIRTG